MVRKLQLSEDARRRISEAARKSNSRRWGDPIERFWSRVDKSQGPKECWIWSRCIGTGGYGRAVFEGKHQLAHRVAWQTAFGPIPERKHVLHRCDNPLCVNPKHLWIGSHKDNMEDRDAKGRQSFTKGKDHGNAKLSDEDVKNIRLWFAKGAMQRSLAERFSVHPSTINDIVHRRSWKHIP